MSMFESSESSDEEQSKMQILVDIPPKKTIILEVESSETVGDIKSKIQDREGIHPCQMWLHHACRPLVDGRTLGDYDIQKESTIHVGIRVWESRMQIHVRSPFGKTYALEVDPSDTIKSLKTQVRSIEGVSVESQMLIYGDKELEDGRTLRDYNVQEESMLHLRFRFWENRIQIFVKSLFGRTFALEVDPSGPVEGLKAQIRCRDGVSVQSQRLIYGGKQLKDGRTLADYNIQKHSTIHTLLRNHGGKQP